METKTWYVSRWRGETEYVDEQNKKRERKGRIYKENGAKITKAKQLVHILLGNKFT